METFEDLTSASSAENGAFRGPPLPGRPPGAASCVLDPDFRPLCAKRRGLISAGGHLRTFLRHIFHFPKVLLPILLLGCLLLKFVFHDPPPLQKEQDSINKGPMKKLEATRPDLGMKKKTLTSWLSLSHRATRASGNQFNNRRMGQTYMPRGPNGLLPERPFPVARKKPTFAAKTGGLNPAKRRGPPGSL